MKTSEDKLNEALRDVLKRKFDDYEEQPNANALERIRARVKPARTGRYWWFTGALVLLSLSGILLSRYAGESESTYAASEKAATRTGNEVIAGVSDHAERAETTAALPKTSAHSAKSVSRKTIWKIPALRSEKLVKSVLEKDPGNQPAAKVHRGQAGNAPGATVNRYERPPSVNAEHIAATAPGNGPVFAPIDAALAEEAPVHVDSAAEIMPLEELASVALQEVQIPLHLRGVVAPAYKPAKVIVTNPARVAWLFNASALHSYQILTVPSSAAQDFQNFSFPTLFTARSMGYKVSGGVERNGIQLQVHFSSFRQTYSYEIANNNYLVKPDDKGQYQTVRQGDRMEENRKFSTLGIGVSKQLRWGHSPVSRFYTTLGAEYAHDLNSSQSLGWVSLGIGKQFAVSRSTAFSIGPYVEFSPVKVKGIANPFYYQPYRVGISAGLRFVRP
jgi:hypothetical protein